MLSSGSLGERLRQVSECVEVVCAGISSMVRSRRSYQRPPNQRGIEVGSRETIQPDRKRVRTTMERDKDCRQPRREGRKRKGRMNV